MYRWTRSGNAIDPDLSRPLKRPLEEGQASDESFRSDRSEMQIGLQATCTPITHTACKDTRLRISLSSQARISHDLLVTENFLRCKYMDCVEVRPVDCFYAGNRQIRPAYPGAENLTEQISVGALR